MSWSILVMLLATAFDVSTTTYKLHQGCVEANPLLVKAHITTPLRISLYEGGLSVGLVYTFGHTEKKHPKLTKAAALSIATSHTVAGVWNLTRDCNRSR